MIDADTAPIRTLADLGHDWRMVATRSHRGGTWSWLGDLVEDGQHALFTLMRDNGSISATTLHTDSGRYHLARIKPGIDPAQAHKAAARDLARVVASPSKPMPGDNGVVRRPFERWDDARKRQAALDARIFAMREVSRVR